MPFEENYIGLMMISHRNTHSYLKSRVKYTFLLESRFGFKELLTKASDRWRSLGQHFCKLPFLIDLDIDLPRGKIGLPVVGCIVYSEQRDDLQLTGAVP